MQKAETNFVSVAKYCIDNVVIKYFLTELFCPDLLLILLPRKIPLDNYFACSLGYEWVLEINL